MTERQIKKLEKNFEGDGFLGLTSKEVEERKKKGLANTAVETPSKTIGEIIASNIFTYFNFVFLFIAALLIAVRSFRDLSFLPLIVINSLIGILQELRAKQILDKLTVLHSPEVMVVRDSKEVKIKIHELWFLEIRFQPMLW